MGAVEEELDARVLPRPEKEVKNNEEKTEQLTEPYEELSFESDLLSLRII